MDSRGGGLTSVTVAEEDAGICWLVFSLVGLSSVSYSWWAGWWWWGELKLRLSWEVKQWYEWRGEEGTAEGEAG
jgi:hypothetical protein